MSSFLSTWTRRCWQSPPASAALNCLLVTDTVLLKSFLVSLSLFPDLKGDPGWFSHSCSLKYQIPLPACDNWVLVTSVLGGNAKAYNKSLRHHVPSSPRALPKAWFGWELPQCSVSKIITQVLQRAKARNSRVFSEWPAVTEFWQPAVLF